MLLAAPVAMRPEMYRDVDGDLGKIAARTAMFLPFWIGLAAAPGYLRALHLMRHRLSPGPGQVRWIHASLFLAVLACAGGIVATWWTYIPIFPLGSAISLVVVFRVAWFFRKFRRQLHT
jgi:hypothetical protein